MNVFEIVGRAQLLRDESNRKLASDMVHGVRALFRRIGQLFAVRKGEPQVR